MGVIAQRLPMPLPDRSFAASGKTDAACGIPAFDLVRDRDALAALGPDWSALFARCGLPHQVFQTFEWLWTWNQHYGGDRTHLVIVTGRLDGRLALVWPLVMRRRLGLRMLGFMGEPVSQYGDAILDPALSDAAQDAAFDYVAALPVDVLAFRRVRADAALAPLLRRRLGAPVGVQHAPFVDFAGAPNVAAFEARYSGKLRSSRRRHVRRLEDAGAVRFEHHRGSPEGAALVALALGFKRDWARRAGIVAPALTDPRFERFFAAAAAGGPTVPDIRIAALRRGADAILGVEISVACKNRLFGHVLAPCPDHEKQGIGGILAGHAITHALEQGFAVYDTLAPADAYKREWTSTAVAVGDYAGSRGIVGALYARLWLGFGRATAKTMLKSLRLLKRRRKP